MDLMERTKFDSIDGVLEYIVKLPVLRTIEFRKKRFDKLKRDFYKKENPDNFEILVENIGFNSVGKKKEERTCLGYEAYFYDKEKRELARFKDYVKFFAGIEIKDYNLWICD